MDIHRIIARLQGQQVDRVTLHLEHVDVAFLVLIATHTVEGEFTPVTEEELKNLYVQACQAIDPTMLRPATAATAAFDRLHRQRVLSRMDGAGMVREGTYVLSALGQHIVDFFVRDEVLDAESLTALLRQIQSRLAEIRAEIPAARSIADWHVLVAVPLRTQIAALVRAIDERGWALTRAHEEAQREIAEQINQTWSSSVDRCLALLERTTDTIAELKTIAITGANAITVMLDEIETQARIAGPPAEVAIVACQAISRYIETVEAWASQAHAGWSEFFQRTQRYIRTMVRLDPGRVLEARLRTAAQKFVDEPWSLCVPHEPSFSAIPRIEIPQAFGGVVRKRQVKDLDVIEAEAIAEIAPLVDAALAGGAKRLTEVLEVVLPKLPAERHYTAIGRVGAYLAQRLVRRVVEEPRWHRLGGGIDIEDLPLRNPK